MEAILLRGLGAGLVSNVTCVTTHVERGVTATLLGHIQPGLVATDAEVFFFAARHGFEELVLVVAGVRIVAGYAVANRGGMHGSLDVGRFLICVASNAKRG